MGPLLLRRDGDRQDDRPNDPSWARLNAKARAAEDRPASFLEMADVFDAIGRDPVYIEAFVGALSSLWSKGTRETMARHA